MFEMLNEARVRQDLDDRMRKARQRRVVARVKTARRRPDRLA